MKAQDTSNGGHRPPLPVGQARRTWGEGGQTITIRQTRCFITNSVTRPNLPSLPSAGESRKPALRGKGEGVAPIGRTQRQNQLLTSTLNSLNPTTNKPRQPTHAVNRVLNTRPISIHLNDSPANKPLTQQITPKSLDLR
jgi:hypothetical protein